MSDKALSLSSIDKIAEFIHTASKMDIIQSLTEEQMIHVCSAIAVLADVDPYFVKAANYQPAEPLMTFQRASVAVNKMKEMEGKLQEYFAQWNGDLRNDKYSLVEKIKLEHTTARDSLSRLATGIIERARMERSPKP